MGSLNLSAGTVAAELYGEFSPKAEFSRNRRATALGRGRRAFPHFARVGIFASPLAGVHSGYRSGALGGPRFRGWRGRPNVL